MSNYTATVIKTGNSYALRVPKDFIDQQGLKKGQKVEIGEVRVRRGEQDHKAVQAAFKELRQLGAFKDIKDPVAWQRKQRRDHKLPYRD